jgi:hypothetical protein
MSKEHLVKFFIEECGMSIDGSGYAEGNTPLWCSSK